MSRGKKPDDIKEWRNDRTKVVDALLIARLSAMQANANAKLLLQDVPISTFGVKPMNPHPNGYNPLMVMFKRSGYRKDPVTGPATRITKSAYAQELEDVALPWVAARKKREAEQQKKAHLDLCARNALHNVGYLFNSGSQSDYFAARHKAIAKLMTIAGIPPEKATEAVDSVLHGRYKNEEVR